MGVPSGRILLGMWVSALVLEIDEESIIGTREYEVSLIVTIRTVHHSHTVWLFPSFGTPPMGIWDYAVSLRREETSGEYLTRF
jgi:hypothetical protein